MNYTNTTLGELLSSENETIRRNATSILKQSQKTKDKYELKKTGQFGHYEVWKNGIVVLSPTDKKMGLEYIKEHIITF